jgi:DNA-binding response OmpR family regulator
MASSAVIPEEGARLVLEIDDQPSESLLKERHLSEMSASRKAAATIEAARAEIKYLSRNHPDGGTSLVIVLDLMLDASADPAEALAFIQEVRSGSLPIDARTPIVVLSNMTPGEVRSAAMAVGASDFFSKTQRPDAFLDQLRFYLGAPIVVRRVVVEVEAVDAGERSVTARIADEEGCALTCEMDWEFVPAPARVPGGGFFLETVKQFRDFETEYRMRAHAVEAEAEREVIARLLAGSD